MADDLLGGKSKGKKVVLSNGNGHTNGTNGHAKPAKKAKKSPKGKAASAHA